MPLGTQCVPCLGEPWEMLQQRALALQTGCTVCRGVKVCETCLLIWSFVGGRAGAGADGS